MKECEHGKIHGWEHCDKCEVRGDQLRCEVCGAGATDVAPDFYIAVKYEATLWTCMNGHKQITGWRPKDA